MNIIWSQREANTHHILISLCVSIPMFDKRSQGFAWSCHPATVRLSRGSAPARSHWRQSYSPCFAGLVGANRRLILEKKELKVVSLSPHATFPRFAPLPSHSPRVSVSFVQTSRWRISLNSGFYNIFAYSTSLWRALVPTFTAAWLSSGKACFAKSRLLA